MNLNTIGKLTLATSLWGIGGCNPDTSGLGTGEPATSGTEDSTTRGTEDGSGTTLFPTTTGSVPTTTEVSTSTMTSGVDTTAEADSTTGVVLEPAVLQFPWPGVSLFRTRVFLLAEEYSDKKATGYEFCWDPDATALEGEENCPNAFESAEGVGLIPDLAGADAYSAKVRAVYGDGTRSPDSGIVTFPVTSVQARLLFNGNADDETGNNNGTLQGGAAFASGFVEQGVEFDGVASYVSIPHSPDFEFGTGDFAISFWFNPSVLGLSQALVDKRETTLSELYLDAEGNLRFGATGCPGLNSGVPMPLDAWTHGVATRNGSDLSLYANGESLAVVTCESDLTNTGDAAVGCLSPDCPDEAFSGLGDELAFVSGLGFADYHAWNEACSAALASALESGGAPVDFFYKTCFSPPLRP